MWASRNEKPFFECVGSGLDAALYPLGEEIKSGRVHRLIDFMRRAYLLSGAKNSCSHSTGQPIMPSYEDQRTKAIASFVF